jgi:hypothetical protein
LSLRILQFVLLYDTIVTYSTRQRSASKVVSEPTLYEEIRRALRHAGWQIDEERPDRIEASDGERYGVAVIFEFGRPASIEYGDGELDLQHGEAWDEAPGILTPAEVGRLFLEEGE